MSFAALRDKKNELIRKATDGSLFIGPGDADHITTLTTYTAGPPVLIDLTPLPDGFEDVGWVTSDGFGTARDVANSEITSFGSTAPTRTDVTSDTTTLTGTMQETKLLTIGLATGADLAAIVADPQSGEVHIKKPTRPRAKNYRGLLIAVDENESGEIWVARYFPRLKVTNFTEQNFNSNDEAINWGVTYTAEEDSVYGASEGWLFGGPGWKSLLTAMGIPNDTP
jgi:hypothetical protein